MSVHTSEDPRGGSWDSKGNGNSRGLEIGVDEDSSEGEFLLHVSACGMSGAEIEMKKMQRQRSCLGHSKDR